MSTCIQRFAGAGGRQRDTRCHQTPTQALGRSLGEVREFASRTRGWLQPDLSRCSRRVDLWRRPRSEPAPSESDNLDHRARPWLTVWNRLRPPLFGMRGSGARGNPGHEFDELPPGGYRDLRTGLPMKTTTVLV